MVGARVPQDWQQLFQALTTASGRKEAEVVREAHAQYLGRTDPGSVQGAMRSLQDPVASLERKLFLMPLLDARLSQVLMHLNQGRHPYIKDDGDLNHSLEAFIALMYFMLKGFKPELAP
jgi:RHH-type rel operon transcriptional repressor/antitoxin RelB